MNIDFNNVYKGKTILVTGDTGFKGSWLSIWLLNLGAVVVGYSLPPRNLNDNYLACGLNKKNIHIDGDIRNYHTLSETISKYNPDMVFHLAAQPLVLDSYNDPLGTFQTNIMGTVNVLEAIRHTNSVKAAIIVTSDKCYDNKEWVYGYREIDPMGGKDPYSASKGACEIITSSYLSSFFNKDNTANIATVRAGNVVGGGDWCTNRIVPDCIKALTNKNTIIIRNPNSIRPWQHVLEPLYGYLILGSKLIINEKKYMGPWNFGPFNSNMVPVRILVEEIIKQWGDGSYIIENSMENYEANILRLDISKAMDKLNWHPVFNFKETIKLVVEEYKVDGFSINAMYNQRIDHINKYIELKHAYGDNKNAYM